MESAQLAPMHELPARQVEILRRGPEDCAALKTFLDQDITALQPHGR